MLHQSIFHKRKCNISKPLRKKECYRCQVWLHSLLITRYADHEQILHVLLMTKTKRCSVQKQIANRRKTKLKFVVVQSINLLICWVKHKHKWLKQEQQQQQQHRYTQWLNLIMYKINSHSMLLVKLTDNSVKEVDARKIRKGGKRKVEAEQRKYRERHASIYYTWQSQ